MSLLGSLKGIGMRVTYLNVSDLGSSITTSIADK